MDKAELAARVKASAYLEGDFVLRSGRRSKYYMDKYLFETQPDILAELGRLFAARAGDADVIAGKDPQLEKAIEIVLSELAKRPPASPQRPKYPIRVK